MPLEPELPYVDFRRTGPRISQDFVLLDSDLEIGHPHTDPQVFAQRLADAVHMAVALGYPEMEIRVCIQDRWPENENQAVLRLTASRPITQEEANREMGWLIQPPTTPGATVILGGDPEDLF